MQHKKTILAAILFLITGFIACESNEIGDSKDVNPDKVYMDYRISYTEGEENVSLNFNTVLQAMQVQRWYLTNQAMLNWMGKN